MFSQGYDPLGNAALSTFLAALPIIVLLGALGWFKLRAYNAALIGLATALVVAVLVYRLPASMALSAALYGAAFGLLPIGWIVINALFLYQLTNQTGRFAILRETITAVTPDRRLQLILVAFGFGSFLEGAAGLGAPVAVIAAMLMGMGFPPLAASGLALIANTVPVAFGGLGVPLISLQAVTNLDLGHLSIVASRQLAPFCVLIPFWVVWVFAGFGGMLAIWPAALVAGGTYSASQVLIAQLHGPWLVSIASPLISMGALVLFLKVWHPKKIWLSTGLAAESNGPVTVAAVKKHTSQEVIQAWTPWVILTIGLLIWGLPQFSAFMNGLTTVRIPVPNLHNLVQRVPPAVAVARLEPAIFVLNWFTAPGSVILISAIISGFVMGLSPSQLVRAYWVTMKNVKFALLTIAAMVAVGFTTRYAGLDATIGLAFARTGVLYPFFGTLVGWLGVISTGSDSSSNVLFGSQQRITAEQLGLDPILTAASNTTGGTMGKMVSSQSIVIASTATNWHGHEGDILRYVFFHSLTLVCLLGVWIFLMAYVYPFSLLMR